MKQIQLWQLLQYLGEKDDPDNAGRIQIVTENREWDDYEELSVLSDLLEPFKDWYVWSLEGSETDDRNRGNIYCLRVEIRKEPWKEQEDGH